MLMPVVAEVFGNIGITKDDVGFICSGSTDYLVGGPFSFVAALDAVGVWPPRAERHVEMDGAWALYEAWVLLQEGEIDAALVYCFGRSSPGDLSEILAAAARPLLPGAAVARPDVAGRAAGAGADRRRHGHRGRLRRRRQPGPAGRRPGQPQGPGGLRPLARGAAGRGLRGGPAAPPRPAADHRRRAPPSCWPPATGPTSWCERPALITGIDHRIETHCARRPRPDRVAVDTHGRREGRGGRRARSTWPSCTRRSPTRS